MRNIALLIALAAAPAAAAPPVAVPPPTPTPAVAPTPAAPTAAPTAPTAPSTPPTAAADARRAALTANVLLKVIHVDQVRATLAAAARAAGGYPVRLTDTTLSVKLPPAKLTAFVRGAAEHGIVLQKTMNREDLTETIADLEGRLRSKSETFQRLRTFFDHSDLTATLEVEQTMGSLVAEVEQVKGQLRLAEDRVQWSVVEVQFQFHPRDHIVYVESPFEWLNTVDLPRFVSEFEEGR